MFWIAVLLLARNAAAAAPGFAAAVGASGMDALITKVIPAVLAGLSNTDVPGPYPIPGSYGPGCPLCADKLGINNFHIGTLSVNPAPTVSGLGTQSGSLLLRIGGFAGSGSADISGTVELWPIPVGFDLTASSSFTDLSFDIALQLSDDGTHFAIAVSSCATEMGSSDLSVSLSGNDILGTILSVLQGAATDALRMFWSGDSNPNMCTILEQQIVTQVNAVLETINLVLPIDAEAELDYSPVGAPSLDSADGAAGISFKGEFAPIPGKAGPIKPPPFQPAALPPLETKRMLAAWLTGYVPGTASWVYEQLGMLDYLIDSVEMGQVCGGCNTSSSELWKNTLPGLQAKYPNAPVQLRFTPTEPIVPTVNASGLTVAVTSDVSLEVVLPNSGRGNHTGTVASTTAMPVVNLSVTVTNVGRVAVAAKDGGLFITGDLALSGISPPNVTWSGVGPVHFVTVAGGIVELLVEKLLLPAINKVAGHGVQIPLHLDGVELQNPSLVNANGYVLMESDFVYNPTGAHRSRLAAFGRELALATFAAATSNGTAYAKHA